MKIKPNTRIINKRILGALALVVSGTLFLESCRDKQTVIITINVTVYKNKSEIINDISMKSASDIQNAGKIFYKDGYIFLTEAHEGVHIINNLDPRNPINEAFLNVPGAYDVTIKDDRLYCDNYTDLVVFDISNINNIQEIERVENVFMYNLPEHDQKYGRAEIDPSKGIVVDWKIETYEEELTPELEQSLIWGESSPLIMMDAMINTNNSEASFGASTSFESSKTASYGIAGSMSKFSIVGSHLYTIDGWKINVFDISNTDLPVLVHEEETWREMETIFPVRQNIFIGTTSGMMIYSLDDPDRPNHLSTYEHATACDPVIVKDDYAYVTLRTGSQCGGWQNLMDIVDISDLSNPIEVNSYEFTNPHGLSISDNTLFLCDGDAGLRVLNLDAPTSVSEISHFSNIHAKDVIAYQDVLMLIGEGGLYQYDYSNVNDVQLLSHIGF